MGPTSRRRSIIFAAMRFAALAAFLIAPQARAAELSECAVIENPQALLDCYERLTRQWLATRPRTGANDAPFVPVESEEKNGWQLTASDLDNGLWHRINLRLYAKRFWVRSSDKADLVRLKDLRPSLWFRCIDGHMSGYIDWGVYLEVEKAKITFKYDNEQAQVAFAPVSADREKIEALDEKHLIARIKQMFGKRTLTASVVPLGEKPVAVTFDISQTETAVRPLRKSCGW
jgi:hypothetical protein